MRRFSPLVLLIVFLPLNSAPGDLLTHIDFGTTGPLSFGAGDIVNAHTSGANLSAMASFDVFAGTSATTVSGGSDGLDDVIVSFAVLTGSDPYGGGVLDVRKGVTHDINQDATGFRGSIPVNQSSANHSSSGDVHGYSVRVQFADHLVLHAEDFQVLLSSSNTLGTRFESTSLVFEDETGAAFGAASYNGFWDGAPRGSAGGTNDSNISTSPYTVTGTGVWLAASTDTVDVTNSDSPTAGLSSPLNGIDPFASTDAGLPSATRIGGFLWTVRLEDVSTTANDDDITAGASSFTATLNGVNINIQSNASAVPEPGSVVSLTGLIFLWALRRRRSCRVS